MSRRRLRSVSAVRLILVAVVVGTVVVSVAAAAPGDVVLVSTDSSGEALLGTTQPHDISGDGTKVTFTYASTLYLKDVGSDAQTVVSRAGLDGPVANRNVFAPTSSSDLGLVAFSTESNNLHPDDSAPFPTCPGPNFDLARLECNRLMDVYVKNTVTGEVLLASRNAAGVKSDRGASAAVLSEDGSTIVFSSPGTNMGAGSTCTPPFLPPPPLIGGWMETCTIHLFA